MRILTALALLGLASLPATAAPSSARELINTLKTRRISVKFKSASLDTVVKYVRAAAGINIVVKKHKIQKDGGDADAIEIDLKVRNVTVLDFLKLAFDNNWVGESEPHISDCGDTLASGSCHLTGQVGFGHVELLSDIEVRE